MNVMRHLRVPNGLVEAVLGHMKDEQWLAIGYRVMSDVEGHHRLIPISTAAPPLLDGLTPSYEVVDVEGLPDDRPSTDWWKYLTDIIGEAEVALHGEAWPSNHEFIGDMMILRIDDNVSQHTKAIAKAKMQSHPHVRLVMKDRGVQGELRIRDIEPIGCRDGENILTSDFPPRLIETRVMVRESGKNILCDPTKAYFSTKLQAERLETRKLAIELREKLGRPLRVCDPFCGVGPALSTLLTEPELVGSLLAADLNPDAIEMLLDNLRRWDKREYPKDPSPITRVYDDRIVGFADALKLPEDQSIAGQWDVLLVNLPHRTVEFLPSLVPLLDRSTPSLVRGRVIVEENGIEEANRAIRQSLPPILEGHNQPALRIKRDYSSTLRLCSFEAWISPES